MENGCLQMMLEPCSKIPNISSMIHLQGMAKGSKQHPNLPLTPQVPLDLLDHTVQPAQQMHIWQSFFLLQASLKA